MRRNFFIFTMPIWQTAICLVFVALFFSPIESIPILLISSVLCSVWFIHTKLSLYKKEREAKSVSSKNDYKRLVFLTTSSFLLWLVVLNSVGFLVKKINPQAQNITLFAEDANMSLVLLFLIFPLIFISTSIMLVYLHLKKPAQNLETIKS